MKLLKVIRMIRVGFFLVSVFVLLAFACNNDIPINYQKGVVQDSSKEKLIRINRYLNNKDRQKIESYIAKKNWKMSLSNSGFYYAINSNNSSSLIKEGDKVEIAYKVSLLNDIQCYSSDSTGNKVIIVGKANIIQGLCKAISLLRLNDEAKFIFPAFLAHGLLGDQICIPARATIVYEVKVLAVN